jgi:hypothetical protein
MIKTEAKKPLDTFDREASDMFEMTVQAQIDVLKKNGMLREGLKALADILQRELQDIDNRLYKGTVLHPGATELLMRAIGMSINHPGDTSYVLSKAELGMSCLRNWIKMDEESKSHPPGLPGCHFDDWFAVDTGNQQTVQEFVEELKHTRNRISDNARVHLEHCYAPVKESSTHYLAAMMPAQIGLDTGGDFRYIRSAAAEYGLLECDLEDVMYVMHHYGRRGRDCSEYIFSATSYLGRLLCMVWDEDDECWVLRSRSPQHSYSARTRFIFRKKWVKEEEKSEE